MLPCHVQHQWTERRSMPEPREFPSQGKACNICLVLMASSQLALLAASAAPGHPLPACQLMCLPQPPPGKVMAYTLMSASLFTSALQKALLMLVTPAALR
jgi:hypothetical protein